MSKLRRPDLCVVGAGSGGLSVAAVAASFGVPVVLVERGRMGGECLNAGCVPSKALIAAGDLVHAIRGAGAFGIAVGEPEVRMERVRDHIQEVIDRIAPNDSPERFSALGVTVIRASARFMAPDTLVAGPDTIQARRFVLATGSRPALPPIPGLADVPFLTNETVFDLAERPRHLLIIGGGPIGVEIAQAHRRLGAAVTLLEAGSLLGREDPELAGVVERALLAEGIAIRQGARIVRVEAQDGDIALTLEGEPEPLQGSHLLVATGRAPVTDDLGLEEGGIAHDRTGILVDGGLRSVSNRRVYAIGDCAGGEGGGPRLTHAAGHQAGLVVRNALFRLPVRANAAPIPRVTYTDPELAAVGLSEAEARERGIRHRILRWPVAENDRAQAERTTAGHIKAVVAPNGRILGCGIAAPRAGDLITPWTLALAKGLKAQDLAGLVVPYPTLSEISRRVAVEHLRPLTRNTWARRLVALARRLG